MVITILLMVAVFLLIKYILDCLAESLHFHDWGDEE
jgi:preprotein translocase subunit SecE